MWELDCKESWMPKNWCFQIVVLEKTLECPLDCKEINHFFRKLTLNIYWKDWCWSWSSNTLATWCEEQTQWKRPWCWESLSAKREEGGRGWDGRIALLTQWTWTWANSGRQWGTERPGMLQSMGWRRVRHWLNDWTTWCTLKLENHWNKTRWKVESNHSMIWADINWVPRFPRGPCNFHNRLTICWSH